MMIVEEISLAICPNVSSSLLQLAKVEPAVGVLLRVSGSGASLKAIHLQVFTIEKVDVVHMRCAERLQLMKHEYMEKRNHSRVTEFLILGFPEFPEQLPLFALFSLLYLMALLGNLLVICIVCADQHLHKPMFFFLANLSALDICSLSTTIPKLLAILLTNNSKISFSGCILQMYCYMMCVATEFLLLTAMAYDRYVAICNPLRYSIIMNKRVCALLASVTWVAGLLEAVPHTIVISQFSYCDSNVMNHFFCETTALLELSCTDTSVIENMTYVESVLSVFTPFLLTLTSYISSVCSTLQTTTGLSSLSGSSETTFCISILQLADRTPPSEISSSGWDQYLLLGL
ncbi:olfactory receptor-like protein OLF4 [Rhinatrema bivittatum]|uniref:olfactory receptor-like protein OLF4 n=1 Tax=Rhinatrema bivittatum TaxID=194408 RepID=UPI00112A9110|nr:olfactory receptor-like protein OLF4 [Rhinatrema bivittatum]